MDGWVVYTMGAKQPKAHKRSQCDADSISCHSVTLTADIVTV